MSDIKKHQKEKHKRDIALSRYADIRELRQVIGIIFDEDVDQDDYRETIFEMYDDVAETVGIAGFNSGKDFMELIRQNANDADALHLIDRTMQALVGWDLCYFLTKLSEVREGQLNSELATIVNERESASLSSLRIDELDDRYCVITNKRTLLSNFAGNGSIEEKVMDEMSNVANELVKRLSSKRTKNAHGEAEAKWLLVNGRHVLLTHHQPTTRELRPFYSLKLVHSEKDALYPGRYAEHVELQSVRTFNTLDELPAALTKVLAINSAFNPK